MWCCGVNVPKLRAIIATVRNFARAAFTTFGVVVFCLLMSLSSPFLFKLWSVQAMDTCIAPAAPRAGGGRTPGPPRAAAAQHGRQSPGLALPELGGLRESRAATPRCRRQRNASSPRQPHRRLRAHSGLTPGSLRARSGLSAAMLLLQPEASIQSGAAGAPLLHGDRSAAALPRRRLPAAAFKSLRASCERWSAKC